MLVFKADIIINYYICYYLPNLNKKNKYSNNKHNLNIL